jgi:hypothetical protein
MAKTREELILKKRELQNQIDALDRVLEMFPAEKNSASQRGNGRYAEMSMASAMLDYLRRMNSALTVSEISKGLRAEGIQSDSPNFNTIVSAVGNRLEEQGKVARRKKNGRKAFIVTTTITE